MAPASGDAKCRPELAEVIEKLGWGRAQIQALLLGGSVWAADGAELLLIGAVTRAVSVEWDLNGTQRGTIVSVVFIGVFVGNLLSGGLGDHYGRRLPIVASYAGVFVFSLLSVLAWDFYSMAFIRFLVGVSFGVGQPAWNAISVEICPSEKRMHMQCYGMILFALGELYSALLIWVDDPRMIHLDWRWLICMGAIPSIFFFILSFLWLLESPSFLLTNGRDDEAKQVLEKIRAQNGHPETMAIEFNPNSPQTIRRNSLVAGRMGAIFGPKMAYTTLVAGFSCFVLNFIFYGGLYAFPQVLPEIDSGLSPAASLMFGASMEIPGFLFGLVVGLQVTRKLGMQFYLVCCCACTLIFIHGARQALSHQGLIPLHVECMLQFGFIGNKVFTSVGFLIVYCYSIEIYPTFVRATGTAICLASGRIGAICSPLLFEWVTAWSGTPLSFMYIMAILCVVNAIFVQFLTIETKGALLTEHEEDDESKPLQA